MSVISSTDDGGGIQSALNSSVTPLASSATFTGIRERNNSPDVACQCSSDTDGTLFFDFSVNGTTWSTFPVAGFSVKAGINEFHTAVKLPRYFRARFVNGADAQSSFNLTVYYGQFRQGSAPLNQGLSLDSDAIAVRPSDFIDEVSLGLRAGVSSWTKFGYKDGATASAGEQTIWAEATNLVVMTTSDTFTVTYNSSTDGVGTTGALSLFVSYIDGDFKLQEALHTLGGTGSDVTAFTGLGVNRIVLLSTGTANTNTNDITLEDTTLGNIQAIMPALGSVTQQCIFHVPVNSDAVIKGIRLSANKLSGGGNPRILFKGYVYSRFTETSYEIFREVVDTQSTTHIDVKDPVDIGLSGRDVVYFTMDTDTNATNASGRFSLLVYQNS